ncbi:MAG TPA: enoyl-CoA hydratase-related protein [Beijerinckiaceae bacterium]|nr:enoyl-CoA hydratase-related protein [Beijerinckiaceae bacterium]
MTYANLIVTIEHRVATLTLNRPAKLNAFSAGLHADLRSALAAAADDAGVRAVVLTGAGRAFSSGQDLTEDLPRHPDGRFDLSGPLMRDYNPLIERLMSYPKPVIAALNGPAVGASMNIALACDIVLATRSAYLQEGFAKIALVPDAGGTWVLPRLVGFKRALALSLTADRVSADDAERMGLVYKVYDDAAFAGEVATLARRLADGPAHCFGLIKRALAGSLDNDLGQQLAIEAEMQQAAADHPDFMEGVMAFLQKRPPQFK